jgi:L-aminopeptidase/D-esterase-like protein
MPDQCEWHDGLTDIEGIKVGHFTDARRPTGCTVILCEEGATAGFDSRGGAPGTVETDMLRSENTVQQIQGVALAGGSAFGLETAAGVVRYLRERGRGFRIGGFRVPIVPAAVLFDLLLGDGNIHPTADSGYKACLAATAGKVAEGNIGAGAGCAVGKLFGPELEMKSGIGTTSLAVGKTGLVVAALMAVNAVGDIYDPTTGKIIAGARSPDGKGFINSAEMILRGYNLVNPITSNTTIGVVATNAELSKAEITKIAQMAHDGLARTINPVHTQFDGDTIFVLATGRLKLKVSAGTVGMIAAEVTAQAVIRAVKQAEGIPGLPSYRDLQK